MKRTSIKIAVFTLVCAILCIGTYALTAIEFVLWGVDIFFAISYFAFVAFLCGLIQHKSRYSTNYISILISFSIALYFGSHSYAYTGFTNLNYMEFLVFDNLVSLDRILFVASSVLCLVFSIVFMGKLIFGAPASKHEDTVIASKPISLAEDPNSWQCSCGSINSGHFCPECGAQAAVVTEESETTDNIL